MVQNIDFQLTDTDIMQDYPNLVDTIRFYTEINLTDIYTIINILHDGYPIAEDFLDINKEINS